MKALRLAALAGAVLLLVLTPGMAQAQGAGGPSLTDLGQPGQQHSSYILTGGAIAAGLGAGLTIIGAGIGFGRIGSAALEGMARQPEVAGSIQTAMLIIAALLEGVAFFSLIVCIIAAGHAGL